MATLLIQEQQQALREQAGKPVEVIDPATNRVYLIIEREQYERLRPLFEDDPMTAEEQRNLLRAAGKRAGWDDAQMELYDRYDQVRDRQS